LQRLPFTGESLRSVRTKLQALRRQQANSEQDDASLKDKQCECVKKCVSHFLPLANRKLSKTKIATNKIMHAITANEKMV
jgi:hypothetical protein